jgi:predicted DNA-binding protein
METLYFKASKEMAARLELLAGKSNCSKDHLICEALEAYFEEIEDYLEAKAYKASYNPNNNISLEEIKRKYKLND